MSVQTVGNGSSVRKQVQLPWGKAIEFAFKSIKIRFLRSLITAGGVFLGIAFLASILVSKAVAGSHIEQSEAARLNWLVALSLAVCVVGITNSMLMSVSERFREIGTMKCLGALDGFIVKLFLLESLFQGVVGTTLGILLGLALSMIGAVGAYGSFTWKDLPVIGILVCAGVCLAVGVALTVAGAVYPAWQAARMQPIEAMRVET